jgi:hypothetical protein
MLRVFLGLKVGGADHWVHAAMLSHIKIRIVSHASMRVGPRWVKGSGPALSTASQINLNKPDPRDALGISFSGSTGLALHGRLAAPTPATAFSPSVKRPCSPPGERQRPVHDPGYVSVPSLMLRKEGSNDHMVEPGLVLPRMMILPVAAGRAGSSRVRPSSKARAFKSNRRPGPGQLQHPRGSPRAPNPRGARGAAAQYWGVMPAGARGAAAQ